MQKLLGAWGKLVSGNAANGLLQLAIFAIAAHALDLAALGIIILIQAYVRVVDGLINFQSVNVLTNFLAGAQEAGDNERVRGLIKAGLFVDFGTAFLATLIAVVCLPLIAPWLGLEGEWILLAVAYCAVIATRTFGAVEAALRCFDRFGAISFRPVISSLAVFLGSIAAWVSGAGAQVFLLIWLLGEGLANLAFLAWALVSLRRHGLTDLRQADARTAIASSRNFWSMMWQTNATFGIRMLSQEGDVLIAGAVLGPVAASLLRAAKNLANLVGQFGRPLQQVASAPIARFTARGEPGLALAYSGKVAAAAFLAGLLLAAVMWGMSGVVLSLAFGAEFAAAAAVTAILFCARAIYLSGVTLMPVLIAFDKSAQFLGSVIAGTLAFFAVLGLCLGPLGLLGVGVAHIAFELVWSAYGWIIAKGALSQMKLPKVGA